MEIEQTVRLEPTAQIERIQTGGPTGNSRLTGLTAAVLLVLLAVEGATLLSLQSFLSVHVFVGMLLVPIVGVKLASTGYRFVRYYTGKPAYVSAGPPPILLRLLGPIVVFSTVGLFASGVALVVLGPGQPLMLGLHKASFAVWLASMSAHVLAHLIKIPALTVPDVRGGKDVGGSRLRLALVAAAVVAGAILAVATLPLATPWMHVIQLNG